MTNGQVGELPEGYQVAKASLFWGADPNKVVHWPVFWVELAAVLHNAESEARRKKEQAAARKQQRQRGKRRG